MAKDFEIKIDRKGLELLYKRCQDLNQKEIQYGYFDKQYQAPDRRAGTYVADVAYKQEIGFDVGATGYAPPRPFFSQSIAKAKWLVTMAAPTIYQLSFAGKLEKSLLQLGQALKETVQDTIDEQDFIPLSTVTIAKKGSNVILKETNTLYDSVEAKIVNSDAYGDRKKEVNI